MFCGRKNEFCYICGQFMQLGTRKYRMESPGNQLSNLYKTYFNRNYIGDVWYAPNVCCESCHRTIYGWSMQEAWKSFGFSRPMIWRERAEGHDSDNCYFCKTNTHGYTHSTRHHIQYQYSEFALQPYERCPSEHPPPSEQNEPAEFDPLETVETSMRYSEYSQHDLLAEMRRIPQSSFDDICRNIK